MFHQNIDHIFTPVEGSSLSFEEHIVKRLMKSADGLVLAALDGTKVVGYAIAEIREPSLVYKREKYGNIIEMAVTASYRRKRVGKKMVDEIFKWFQLENVNRVELQTAAQNVVSNSFWQKHGFAVFRYTLYKEIK
jgi:ribosomal protein S18 acetylase RimI-like enzyme